MIGKYRQQPAGYKAFIPAHFPPKSYRLSEEVQLLLEQAHLSLGRLDGITELLPDVDFFILMYIRKEATVSSQVEGTQANMMEAIIAESQSVAGLTADVTDILDYIEAMNFGLNRLVDLPLSSRLIREVHERLLRNFSAGHAHVYPGEFRKTQNWIGGASPSQATYCPPPPDLVPELMSQVEQFLHDGSNFPTLVRAGLAHAQFETIHPFVDGNGRTGRLLLTLFLKESKVLRRPVLYLSDYFKTHRRSYFERLQAYHDSADVDGWLRFFLAGVTEIADEAFQTVQAVTQLRERHVPVVAGFGKNSQTALELLRSLYAKPVVSVSQVEQMTKLSRPNANNLVKKFADAGILVKTNKDVNYARLFIYRDYIDIFGNP